MRKYVCFDTETGGLNPFKNGICSITMKIVGTSEIKTWFIKPNMLLDFDDKAMEINGLSLRELDEKGLDEKDAVEEIKKFMLSCGKPNLVAHNIIFDMQFMNALFNRNGDRLFTDFCYYHPQDTMMMAKTLSIIGRTQLKKFNLKAVHMYLFGKNFNGQHTSHGDVLATEKVFLKLLKEIKEY
jgi:DNA polymerase III alpha subunit (gram-positive type)